MKLTRRWQLLLGGLAASAGLALFGPPARPSAEVVAPVRTVARPPVDAPSVAETDGGPATGGTVVIAELRPRVRNVAPVDAFATQSWNPPPAPTAPANAMLANTKPVAPPLPFTVLGKKLEDGAWQVFLAQDEKTYVAGVNETIAGSYRIESISPPIAVLTYLPLGERQTLQIGSAE